MRLRPAHTCLLLLFVAMPALAQTTADLDSRYSSIKACEVRPGVLLTVKFDGSGQASEMVLEKRRMSGAAVDYEALLPPAVVEELISELVPVGDRGKELEFSGIMESNIGGGTTWYDFENVHVTRISVFASPNSKRVKGDVAVIINWKKRGSNNN
jgi:hypothetical protein